jgi:hypothetical protein
MPSPAVWIALALIVFGVCVLMVLVFGFETRYADELRERDGG